MNTDTLKFGCLIVLVVGLICSGVIVSYATVSTETITVTDKERVVKSEDSYYLVFTENEVFKNDDSLLHMKFGSSDVQGKLKIGDTYKVKVNWFRFPITSSYRNILEVKANVAPPAEE